MLVDDNLVPDGPNSQLDPYFIKLIVQSPTGLLGKECKPQTQCHGQSIPKGWSSKTTHHQPWKFSYYIAYSNV